MIIREYQTGDLAALRQLYLRTRKQAFHWMDIDGFALEDFDRDTQKEQLWVGVGESGGIDGFVSAWMPEHFIHNLYVLPKKSRRGIGSQLLQHCLTQIGRPARLKCSTSNEDALGFYTMAGWHTLTEGQSPEGPFYLMEYRGA